MAHLIETSTRPDVTTLIKQALEEDVHDGDRTTNSIVPHNINCRARWIAKNDGIVAGLFVGQEVFETIGGISWTSLVEEGGAVSAGTKLVEIEGSARTILTGERTALNFVQRMSGIATATNAYVEELEGTGTSILDTRKTLPGHRALDKYAVRAGGGENHRAGLYDMILIKENHIAIAGGIQSAVTSARRASPELKVEVETKSIDEVKNALNAGADIIMLDNMSLEEMDEAVQFINGRAKTEASGNVTIDRLKAIAQTRVDYISAGALTHSVSAFDISQLIE